MNHPFNDDIRHHRNAGPNPFADSVDAAASDAALDQNQGQNDSADVFRTTRGTSDYNPKFFATRPAASSEVLLVAIVGVCFAMGTIIRSLTAPEWSIFVFLALPFSVFAWIKGRNELQRVRYGQIIQSHPGRLHWGMWLGCLTTLILLASGVWFLYLLYQG
ncbi:MAG: hypothetical protein R3E01_14725 [Pirellulaceae bacterium]|nr:hypothetical protein [Planctomycetales bacterium]